MSTSVQKFEVIVTCRECGKFDCRITKGLCQSHYQKDFRRRNPEIVAQRDRIQTTKKDPEKEKARKAAMYAANKEEILNKAKLYQSTHKEEITARKLAYKSRIGKEVLKKRSAESYQRHKLKRNAECKAYAIENKDAIAEAKRKYREKNLDSIREKVAKNRAAGKFLAHNKQGKARRRARRLSAGGFHSVKDIRNLKVIQKGKCAVCRTSIVEKYHLDHIMPLALGGDNSKENLQLLCPTCNLQKGAKHPIDFMKSKGFLL